MSHLLQVSASPLNHRGKQKRKMVIRGMKLAGKQLAAMELHRRVHCTDTRLHSHYIAVVLKVVDIDPQGSIGPSKGR